jgi:preprotein translocase subunit YajC
VNPFLTFAMMPPPSGSSGGLTVLIIQVVAIGAIFWFLIIRPQGQARKKHEELLAGLKRGDEVMTAGGVLGKVKDVKENKEKGEVRVTIESGESTLVVERSRIVRVGGVSAPQA